MTRETENPPATADVPAGRVTRILYIEAPIDAVWDAIATPEGLVQWLGDLAVFPDGLRAGAHGRIAWTGEVVLATHVLHADAPHSLSFQWAEGVLVEGGSTVTFTLEPGAHAGETKVKLEEAGFPGLSGAPTDRLARLRGFAQGWTVETDELTTFVESQSAHRLVS